MLLLLPETILQARVRTWNPFSRCSKCFLEGPRVPGQSLYSAYSALSPAFILTHGRDLTFRWFKLVVVSNVWNDTTLVSLLSGQRKTKTWTGKMAPWIHCLPCKNEDLNAIPRTQVNEPNMEEALTVPVQKQANPRHPLASQSAQPSQQDSGQWETLSQKPRWDDSQGCWPLDFTCVCKHTHTHRERETDRQKERDCLIQKKIPLSSQVRWGSLSFPQP